MTGRARYRVAGVVLLLAAQSGGAAPGGDTPSRVVRRFYEWTLRNGEQVRRLEPRVSWDPENRRLALDTTTLPEFVAAFMDSGLFAPEFATILSGYYRNHGEVIAATPPDLLDTYATHGRDILLETEDMDIFFCAQEMQYTTTFIRRMTLRTVHADADRTDVRSTSTYGWKTDFTLRRVDGRWRIAGYCVFR